MASKTGSTAKTRVSAGKSVPKFVAICDDTADTIWATGTTEKTALANLWASVHKYLVEADAFETKDYSSKQLAEFFSYSVINLSEGAGRLRN